MSDQFEMFVPETFEDTGNAISSLESACGPTPCASPGGPTTGQSGPLPARASRSRRPASGEAPRTRGTCGPSLLDSSPSAALTFSLASRLRARTDSLGSTMYRLTWKVRRTPSGRPIPALRATARPTSASGFTGWPSPQAMAWRSGETGSEVAILAGWPTPQARDHFPAHSPDYVAEKQAQGHGMANLNDHVALAGWSTATVNDARSGCNATANRSPEAKPAESGWTLVDLARLTGWGTPCSQPANGTAESFVARKQRAQAKGIQMGDSITDCAIQAQLAAHGPERIGFCAGPSGWEILPASGQLSPLLSGFLMGVPPMWDLAAILANPRRRKKEK